MSIRLPKLYNILLLGDSCTDIYHFGSCHRISPEAPVPILKESYIETRQGMALNVKNNLNAFGHEVDFYTNNELVSKHRFVDIKSKSQMLRVDVGETKTLEPFDIGALKEKKYDAIVISDYDKGFLPFSICEEIIFKYKNLPTFVDSKKRDLSCFKSSIIKVNEKEHYHHHKIHASSSLVITHGSQGATFKGQKFPTKKVEVHDVCGAGDVFLSALVCGFLHTNDLPRSIMYANKLASLSVTRFGTYILTKREINGVCL